jgi:hypothetical protein
MLIRVRAQGPYWVVIVNSYVFSWQEEPHYTTLSLSLFGQEEKYWNSE